MSETERKRRAKKYADEGRKVWVEQYPGGDMQIEIGHIDNLETLYLTSSEAEALRECLDEVEQEEQDA